METLIDRPAVIKEITERFQALTSLVPLHAISNKKQYEKAVSMLNLLLDSGGAKEETSLGELAGALGSLIADYEDLHEEKVEVSPVAALKFLMTQHNLKQSDLSELGSQGVVSEILHGKRDLNVKQIKKLANKFHVPATVFI